MPYDAADAALVNNLSGENFCPPQIHTWAHFENSHLGTLSSLQPMLCASSLFSPILCLDTVLTEDILCLGNSHLGTLLSVQTNAINIVLALCFLLGHCTQYSVL